MTSTENKIQPRLKTRYREEIKAALNTEFDYANVMQIPGVVKVVVNMGVGDAARDAKLINGAVNDLALITGQKPEIRKARKSIAQFKLREGMPIVPASRCVATACGSSWTVSCPSRFPASGTSAACRATSSTATATTRSA